MGEIAAGDSVYVTTPEDFIPRVRDKVKDGRVGVVKFVRGDNRAIVDFPPLGRRKAFTGVFAPQWLTKVDPSTHPEAQAHD